MSWGQDAHDVPELYISNPYPPGTSFWDQFDTRAGDSAAAKWLLELAQASERFTTLDGWGFLKVFDVFEWRGRYGLKCIDDATQLDHIHLVPGYRPSEFPRIVHVQLIFDTEGATFARSAPVSDEARQHHWQILKRLIDPFTIEPDFILGHFLPALTSDSPKFWQSEQLLFIPPSPSRQRYIRLKKHDGTQVSIMFRAISDLSGLGDGFGHWLDEHARWVDGQKLSKFRST